MSTQTQNEKLLSAKELASEIKSRLGLTVSPQFVRSMLRAGVRRIGYNARISDVIDWWEKHPDFAPRSNRAIA